MQMTHIGIEGVCGRICPIIDNAKLRIGFSSFGGEIPICQEGNDDDDGSVADKAVLLSHSV